MIAGKVRAPASITRSVRHKSCRCESFVRIVEDSRECAAMRNAKCAASWYCRTHEGIVKTFDSDAMRVVYFFGAEAAS